MKSINFYVYNTSGEILRTGSCTRQDVSLQAKAGETAVPYNGTITYISDELHHVVDGKVVNKPAPSYSVKNEQAMKDLRLRRGLLLASCDWTQVSDSPLSELVQIDWQVYRQELRDLPATQSDIENINDLIFPIKPA